MSACVPTFRWQCLFISYTKEEQQMSHLFQDGKRYRTGKCLQRRSRIFKRLSTKEYTFKAFKRWSGRVADESAISYTNLRDLLDPVLNEKWEQKKFYLKSQIY